MINIFCTNTPFQLFMVRNIINNHFKNNQNIIVSTYTDGIDKDLYYIKKIDIKKVLKLKSFIKKNIKEIQFFIPHTGSFFSSYFYHISLIKSAPINVYYEGIAMFYDPIKYNHIQNIKRIIYGLVCGIIYKIHYRLYPQRLIDIAKACYSPISIGLEKYKKIVEVKCNLVNYNVTNTINNVLLILSPSINNKEIELISKKILVSRFEKIYIKPHFELSQKNLDELVKNFNNNDIKYEIINKNIPAEIFFMNNPINSIISQHFSSALINLRILFNSHIPITVINKYTIPKEIIKKLNISI